ncbi:hypothetical protein EUGRSUZ_K00880 [Eucalyptus grandis]|uniref:Uncharacterized protein n=2 Tax=Eucalyptus grandis TaxID=71139 RepID=A0ACC3IRM5_EUCGR|nr:hypothetical protein EUGRSUZ_K00880 [Eucalyptus grandis]
MKGGRWAWGFSDQGRASLFLSYLFLFSTAILGLFEQHLLTHASWNVEHLGEDSRVLVIFFFFLSYFFKGQCLRSSWG